MRNVRPNSKSRITAWLVSLPGCLVLLAVFSTVGQSCPPPPECETPGRYVLWAKRSSTVIAQSELGQSVYLDSYSSQSDRVITYELVSQVYNDGQWQIWYYDLADCGTCNVKPCTFSRSGGSITSSGNNYIMVSYDSSPLAGYVRGTHNGWECYKTQYGGYIIPGGSQINMNVYVVKVAILDADIPEDLIMVQLQPSGLSGFLELALDGDAWHLIRQVSRSSGIHSETFDIPNLPEGEFDFVYASWCLEGEYLFDNLYYYHIRVLGKYTVTQYAIIDETQCSGSPEMFGYTTGGCINTPCTWNSASGKSDWLNYIDELEYGRNGSGRGMSGNHYIIESFCPGGPESHNLRKIGAIAGCPQCGTFLSANESVARSVNSNKLSCDDVVYILGHGRRIVTDSGMGNIPDADHWLDNFKGYTGCNPGSDLGSNLMVIHLVDESQ